MENINYEAFYQDIQQLEKSVKDKLQQVQRSFKSITRDAEAGDIKKLAKDTEELHGFAAALTELAVNLQEFAAGFDSKDYFESGEFTRQMVEYCQQNGVDIKGEAGVYEMFPFRIRVDTENQDLYVNRRKVQCVRPLQFVRDMKKQVEKYTKQSFKTETFLNELVAAYDMATLVRNSKSSAPRTGMDILLTDVYKYLAPTAKARREYDMQQYAYELSRLYNTGTDMRTRCERAFDFGTGKQGGKLIRILDANGAEQFLGTIRFI